MYLFQGHLGHTNTIVDSSMPRGNKSSRVAAKARRSRIGFGSHYRRKIGEHTSTSF